MDIQCILCWRSPILQSNKCIAFHFHIRPGLVCRVGHSLHSFWLRTATTLTINTLQTDTGCPAHVHPTFLDRQCFHLDKMAPFSTQHTTHCKYRKVPPPQNHIKIVLKSIIKIGPRIMGSRFLDGQKMIHSIITDKILLHC